MNVKARAWHLSEEISPLPSLHWWFITGALSLFFNTYLLFFVIGGGHKLLDNSKLFSGVAY